MVACLKRQVGEASGRECLVLALGLARVVLRRGIDSLVVVDGLGEGRGLCGLQVETRGLECFV